MAFTRVGVSQLSMLDRPCGSPGQLLGRSLAQSDPLHQRCPRCPNLVTVFSSFSPPKLSTNLRQHQVAYCTEDLVALQPQVTATFPVVKTQLRLRGNTVQWKIGKMVLTSSGFGF